MREVRFLRVSLSTYKKNLGDVGISRDPYSLGKPYAEAFPHLDVHDLHRASAGESPFHQWVDEDGLILGHVVVDQLGSDLFTFGYRFFGTRNIEPGAGKEAIRVVWRKTGAHWSKPSFQCSGCGKSCSKIYFARGAWKCKSCHDLINLIQRLTPVNKALLQHDTARERLKVVPKTAEDRRKREKDKELFGAARRVLVDNPHKAVLPERFRCRAAGRWLEEGEEPLMTVDDSMVGYGWRPGDRGQFTGLDTRDRSRSRRSATSPAANAEALVEPRSNIGTAAGQVAVRTADAAGDWFARQGEHARSVKIKTGDEPSANPKPSGPPRPMPWFGQF